MDLNLTEVSLILGIVAAASAIVWKIAKPHITAVVEDAISPVRESVAAIQKEVDELQQKKLKDFERLNRQEAVDRAMMAGIFAILGNLEDGNHTGEIKAAKNKLQTFLIDEK
jgi:hypothetical protein